MSKVDEYRRANDFLNKKHIQTAYQTKRTLENLTQDINNIMYVAKRDAWRILSTPVTPEMLTAIKEQHLYIGEIPFKGMGLDFNRAIVDAANLVHKAMGAVTLADPVDIDEASKDTIKQILSRLKKSSTDAELAARQAELDALITAYEEKESDTEREDLIGKWSAIREYLEAARDELEEKDKDAAISSVEEALFQ